MSYAIPVRIATSVHRRLKRASDQLRTPMNVIAREALETWLEVHEGKDDGPSEDGRGPDRDQTLFSISISLKHLKERAKLEAGRRRQSDPKKHPNSVSALVEEAIREHLSKKPF